MPTKLDLKTVFHCNFIKSSFSIDSFGLSVTLSRRLFCYVFFFYFFLLLLLFLVCSVDMFGFFVVIVVGIGQMIELNRVDISRTYQSYFCKSYESKNGEYIYIYIFGYQMKRRNLANPSTVFKIHRILFLGFFFFSVCIS